MTDHGVHGDHLPAFFRSVFTDVVVLTLQLIARKKTARGHGRRAGSNNAGVGEYLRKEKIQRRKTKHIILRKRIVHLRREDNSLVSASFDDPAHLFLLI